MSLPTQPYKGARDFYPEDKRLQKWIFKQWRDIAERYGYEEYDAPVLEPIELYTAKTSEEIVTEQSYVFEDRGGRTVTIRPEMTPSVSRMVAARRQELAYPLRLYSIPNLWRYERQQRGRFREHWQLNIDLFGIESVEAEFEMLQISNEIMKAFGATAEMFEIKLNSRRLINFLLEEYFLLNQTQAETLIRLIDRMKKMDKSEFVAKLDAVLAPDQREKGLATKINNLLLIKSIEELPPDAQKLPSVQTMQELFSKAENSGIKNVTFDITLMRGFDYYTDIVFEVFDKHPENNRAMFGGGRYDGLVGMFGVDPVPTIGFAMGDATLINFLESHNLSPTLSPETEVYAVILTKNDAPNDIVSKLRAQGVKVAVDYSGRKIDKQIKTAVKKDIRYAIFIGDEELATESYRLKNLQTGQEETHSLERIVSIVKDHRNQPTRS